MQNSSNRKKIEYCCNKISVKFEESGSPEHRASTRILFRQELPVYNNGVNTGE